MKYVLWLLAGVGLGFVVAHQVNRTEAGKAFFDDINNKTTQLTDALREGYRERAEELRDQA